MNENDKNKLMENGETQDVFTQMDDKEVKKEAVCLNCGATLSEEQLFCPKCGTAREIVKENICSKCGAKMEDGQMFCTKCGQRVEEAVNTLNNSVKVKKKKIP